MKKQRNVLKLLRILYKLSSELKGNILLIILIYAISLALLIILNCFRDHCHTVFNQFDTGVQ